MVMIDSLSLDGAEALSLYAMTPKFFELALSCAPVESTCVPNPSPDAGAATSCHSVVRQAINDLVSARIVFAYER
jgi:hypothetical protein